MPPRTRRACARAAWHCPRPRPSGTWVSTRWRWESPSPHAREPHAQPQQGPLPGVVHAQEDEQPEPEVSLWEQMAQQKSGAADACDEGRKGEVAEKPAPAPAPPASKKQTEKQHQAMKKGGKTAAEEAPEPEPKQEPKPEPTPPVTLAKSKLASSMSAAKFANDDANVDADGDANANEDDTGVFSSSHASISLSKSRALPAIGGRRGLDS
ncbi:hypothetical protein BJ912DRAFT_1058343 [Pholiota molesta]|nr:hypothetical protein BJ912DRAFT_1058343 [Pholiota molesta]